MDDPPQSAISQVNPLHPLTSLEWRECERIPMAMSKVQAVVLGNKVYVGGDYIPKAKYCLYMSDLMIHTWKTIITPTWRSALTIHQGRLVLVGGWDPFTSTCTNQLWVREDEGTWTQPFQPMPTPRWGAVVATTQNNFIVAGGDGSQGEKLNVVEVYNGQQWATAQSLPYAYCTSAILKGIWYVLIGVTEEVLYTSVESLIASAQSEVTKVGWKTLRVPGVHYYGLFSIAVWRGALIAVRRGEPCSVLSYSPHTQSWVKMGDLPVGLVSTCTTALPTGELLAIGGWPWGSGNPSDCTFKGLLRANQFQPVATFDIGVLERLESYAGINIFREVSPKCHDLIGYVWLLPEQSGLSHLFNSEGSCKRILEQWLNTSQSLLHLPPTWEMLFNVLRDLELRDLAQQIEDCLRRVPEVAVAGPEHSSGEGAEGEGTVEHTEGVGVKEVEVAEGNEDKVGSKEDMKPGYGVNPEGGVAKWEDGAGKAQMKQELDLVGTVGMLEETIAKREKQLQQCEETIQMYKERYQKLLQQMKSVIAENEQLRKPIRSVKEGTLVPDYHPGMYKEQLLQCEETIQIYKERQQKQLQQMESLMAENEQLRKQITQVEEGALVPTVETTAAGYLHGVDVIGETSLTVTNEAQTFRWAGYGLKLHIPPASLPAGMGQSSIDIKASLAGQFNFPENTTLISAVYWLHSPVEFSQPIAVEIQHCASPSDDPSLTFARASEKESPYKFTALEGGLFPTDSYNACIQLNRFSLVAIIQKLWGLLTSRQPERQYCAQVYYTREAVNAWKAHFVITHDLEACITAVRKEYSKAVAGADLDVTFEDKEITLKVPKKGVTTSDQWTVTPLSYPRITKTRVDSFKLGQRLPSCQLQVKWSGEGRPSDLIYMVELQGAKKPSNFFHITLHCESTSRDMSPPVQRSSHKRTREHTDEDGEERSKNIISCDTSQDEADPSLSKRSKPSGDEAPLFPAELRAEPELPEFMNLVAAHIPSKWRLVGIQLYLKDSDLDCIEVISDDPQRSFSSVFTLWKRKETRLPLNWWTVLQALETASVGEQRLARQIKSKLTTASHE